MSHTSLTWCILMPNSCVYVIHYEAEMALSNHYILITQQFTICITPLECDMSLNILLHPSPHTYTNHTYIEPWQCYTDVNLRHIEYNTTMYTNRTDGNFNLQKIVKSEFWIQLYLSTIYQLRIHACNISTLCI